MTLQEQFLLGLARGYHPLINLGNLHACQSPAMRSHTLVSITMDPFIMCIFPVLCATAVASMSVPHSFRGNPVHCLTMTWSPSPCIHDQPLETCALQVFVQESPQDAARAVTGLRARGVLVDCRGCSVRFGFGLNHSRQDVELALEALRSDAVDTKTS